MIKKPGNLYTLSITVSSMFNMVPNSLMFSEKVGQF